MVNNTNYSARFRPLGVDFLTGGKARFVDTYGAVFGELAFEYRFFLQHVDEGYRVDLCSWDWKRKFKEPTGETPITTHVAAARGWQPTGVLVSPDRRYDYSTSGLWQTSRDDAEVTADGADNGKGRLEGVVFHDFALSESFDLGSYGSFAPPAEGRLYVRCRDAWNQLADNRVRDDAQDQACRRRREACPPRAPLGNARGRSIQRNDGRSPVACLASPMPFRVAPRPVYNAAPRHPASIAPPALSRPHEAGLQFQRLHALFDRRHDRKSRQPGLHGH